MNAGGLSAPGSASERTRVALQTAEPPIANARLVGRFHVTGRVVRAKGGSIKVGEKSETAFALVPQCPQGACSTRAVFSYVNRETKKTLTVRILMKRDDAAYTGTGVGPPAKCNGQQIRGTVTIRLTARHGEMISTAWRVTGWSGSQTVNYPATEVGLTYCSAASHTESLVGSLLE